MVNKAKNTPKPAETEERLLSPLQEPDPVEISLRPRTFAEFIGQEKNKENLEIFIAAANKRNQALDHVLLSGPPGLGKTSLAHVLANTLGSKIHCTSGPIIERTGDLAAILSNLERRDVLFIDEIHRLNRTVEEMLYSAMEDFQISVMIGEGPSARSIQLDIPEFTLIGATTRTGLLTSPLRSRFLIQCHLDFYDARDLKIIVQRSSRILKVSISEEAATEIASRARGTPRVANRLLKRVRDWADVKADGKITIEVARAALQQLEVDIKGFDAMDRRILRTIIDNFKGGPVGIETLSSILNEEKDTLEEVYEPFLIQSGFLTRTPRGRVVTERAFKHFNLIPPQETQDQRSLF